FAILRREHQHRDPVVLLAQRAHHPIAGQLRQHDVQDHHVVGLVASRVESGHAVDRKIHQITLGGEATLQRAAQAGLVFDDQDSHLSSLPRSEAPTSILSAGWQLIFTCFAYGYAPLVRRNGWFRGAEPAISSFGYRSWSLRPPAASCRAGSAHTKSPECLHMCLTLPTAK